MREYLESVKLSCQRSSKSLNAASLAFGIFLNDSNVIALVCGQLGSRPTLVKLSANLRLTIRWSSRGVYDGSEDVVGRRSPAELEFGLEILMLHYYGIPSILPTRSLR